MSDADGLAVEVRPGLDAADCATVRALADAALRADGTYPLDDQVLMDVCSDDASTHTQLLGLRADGSLTGYAHLDTRAAGSVTVHLVVDPSRRRRGHGRRLLAAVDDVARTRAASTLRAWAHGDHPAAASLADQLGWRRSRELFQLRLGNDAAIDPPEYPADVSVRAFEVGRDEAAWVDVNAAAFEGHPEQGRVSVADLRQREAQSWFDPAGFFVAERGGEMVGFHWTKVHQGAAGAPDIGEVYVVGVAPSAQGTGLGKALTLTGLRYLRGRGLDVMLYVDGANVAARRLYDRIGFATTRADIMYERELR